MRQLFTFGARRFVFIAFSRPQNVRPSLLTVGFFPDWIWGGRPFLSQKIQSSVLRVGKWHFPTAQNPIGQIFPRIPAELLENRPIFQSVSGWKIAVGKWGGHKPILPETRNYTVCCPNKGQYREVMHKPAAGIKIQGVLRPVGRTRAANVIPAALHC